MDNLNKEDIDYIFKEGSKKHEFPFNESAWDNMELMLDEQDKKSALYKWGALLGLLLVLGFASVYLITNNDSSNLEIIETKDSNIIAVSENQNAIKTTTENQKTEIENSNAKAHNGIDQNITLYKSRNTDDNTNSVQTSKVTSNNSNIVINSEVESTVLTRNRNNKNLSVNSDQKNNSTIYKANSTLSAPSATKQGVNLVASNSDEIVKIESTLKLPTLSMNQFNIENKFEAQSLSIETPKINRLSYQLILGKEWSSVGMMNKMKDGYRIGAGIAYQFGNKLQLSTGLVYSKKIYETEGANYTPLPQFRWVDDVAPESVSGKCDVFEIPLDFTYYFKGFDKNSFFVTGGANTYIMNNEWYDFEFSDPDRMENPDVPKFSNNVHGEKSVHFFGVGMISAGYQKYITKNTAVQIGPYLQLPFTGIGMGDVDLVSAGVQVKLAFSK